MNVENGRAFLRDDPAKGQLYAGILAAKQMFVAEAQADSLPGEEVGKYAMFGFGAQFCEVHVDPTLGRLRVARFLGVYGVGRVINARTAKSQMLGGIIGGLGQALLEETVMDRRSGRLVNASLGDYHLPVHADVGDLDAVFVEEHDPHVNPLGAKSTPEHGPLDRTDGDARFRRDHAAHLPKLQHQHLFGQ